jgi:hypothetical protein
MSAALLQSGDAQGAVEAAEAGLARLTTPPNPDMQWQLAATGSLAYHALGQSDHADRSRAIAAEALLKIQSDWKDGFTTYIARAELADLKRRAALTTGPR